MGQHWYDNKGNACHTVIGQNGKERDTTLRDARKLSLFPSVTSILSVQDKPMLTQWLINELLRYCIEKPFYPFEHSIDVYSKRALAGMREKSKAASERGTEIHNKLEDYYKTGNVCKKDHKYIIPAIRLIENTFGIEEWIAEETFVDVEEGFAGCVDLHCRNAIIDFKTKDKTDIKDMVQYDDHKLQLAAYNKGLKLNARRFNLFISINPETPGLCVLRECEEYDKYLNMFCLLNKFWQLKNNYYPGTP